MGKSSKSNRSTGRKRSSGRLEKSGLSGPRAARGWFLGCAKWTATLAIWGAVATAVITAIFAYDLPSTDKALALPHRSAVTLLARDGSTLAVRGDPGRNGAIRAADVPPHLLRAIIAIEDRRFYDHLGVDWIGIVRAFAANLRAGRIVQGGSTITQQAAKNLFLTPAHTIKRKFQEILLALWLEQRFTKDQILTIYLNRVYLGAGQYGVDAAARRYFGISAKSVTLEQSAVLAGLLKAPSRLNPLRNPKGATKRARVVLQAMVDAGYLKSAADRHIKLPPARFARSTVRNRIGPYFIDWVLEQLPDFVGANPGPVTVRTTLDPSLQRSSERIITATLAKSGTRARVSQAGFVAMSGDGAVRAMVGGRNHNQSQFNRATQALRQPGSAFKPIVYLAGLRAGLRPESRIVDRPLTIGNWRPKNFDGKYRGEMTISEALARSVNTVAVRVAEKTGRKEVVRLAKRMGITSSLTPAPSLALGTAELSLIELTAAYGTFATGGLGVWPYAIVEIADADGRRLYRRAGDGPGRIVEPAHAAQMNKMLAGVIANGTGRGAKLDRPAGGKTGTSQGFRDAWFIGYSAHLVAGVWLGNDDDSPMRNVTGGGLPTHIWRAIMVAAHKGIPPAPLPGLTPLPATEHPGFWQRLVKSLSDPSG